jgi:hypothetical protein
MSVDDVLTIIFAIALLGHGVAHAVATSHLFGQLGGRIREAALPVRSWLLPYLSLRAAAGLAIVFWLPASVGFLLGAPAVLDLVLGDLPWSAMIVAAAVLSAVGIGLFSAIWPGGERRLRPLHIFLALAMDAIILVSQLVLGWPES